MEVYGILWFTPPEGCLKALAAHLNTQNVRRMPSSHPTNGLKTLLTSLAGPWFTAAAPACALAKAAVACTWQGLATCIGLKWHGDALSEKGRDCQLTYKAGTSLQQIQSARIRHNLRHPLLSKPPRAGDCSLLLVI